MVGAMARLELLRESVVPTISRKNQAKADLDQAIEAGRPQEEIDELRAKYELIQNELDELKQEHKRIESITRIVMGRWNRLIAEIEVSEILKDS